MDSSRDIVKRLRENRILAERKNYESMERDELIKLAQDGDQLAIETLVNTHQDFINKMSSKYFLDTGDKDDVKQIATIAFWNAIQSWDGSGDFEAYAGMIIKRKLTDELRKEEAGKSQIHTGADSLDRPVADDGEGGEMTLGSSMSSKDLSPEEQYLGRDGARKIMKFIQNDLSEVERKVILRYIEGYKVSEISEEEGMKYKSVENALKRVKDKLADYLRNVRESKKVKLSEESLFSDEEKQILKSVITKVNKKASLKESLESKTLEEYTTDDFYDSLEDIRDEVEDIMYDIRETQSEDSYNDLLDRLEELAKKVISYDEYIDDEDLSKHADKLYSYILQAQGMEPENLKPVDKYAEVGMRRDDF